MSASRPLTSRMGVPVRYTDPGRSSRVPAYETASALASRAVARTDRPAIRLPSHMSDGTRSAAAATRVGMAT